MGKVAYKIDLPVSAKIHLVFQVSQLKLCKGTPLVTDAVPQLDNDGLILVQPVVVLDRKLAKKEDVDVEVVYLLIQWADGTPDATWEPASEVMARLPQFDFYP